MIIRFFFLYTPDSPDEHCSHDVIIPRGCEDIQDFKLEIPSLILYLSFTTLSFSNVNNAKNIMCDKTSKSERIKLRERGEARNRD